jgi:hypothetical protein
VTGTPADPIPGRDDPDDAARFDAARAIMRVSRVITATIGRAVRPVGLTTRFNVLGLFADSSTGEMRATKIGEFLMIRPSGVTSCPPTISTGITRLLQPLHCGQPVAPRRRQRRTVHVWIAFTSRNSSSPNEPSSRPLPDCL